MQPCAEQKGMLWGNLLYMIVHVHVAVSRLNTWRDGGTYYKGEGIAMYMLGRGRKMGRCTCRWMVVKLRMPSNLYTTCSYIGCKIGGAHFPTKPCTLPLHAHTLNPLYVPFLTW